jgi:WD repeat-containing protein 23
VKFSGDGRELIAGSNDCSIYVFDIERNEVLHRIQGHEKDINSVAFIDPHDPNVLISGSDDSLIKLWDRRSMGSNSSCSGYLIGHTEGITYISAKGDGRHILSNSKDQTMKYWDIRKMSSTHDQAVQVDLVPHWDYRWMEYPLANPLTHPGDVSVKTFVGHKVLRTLIRCHFSPVHQTGQRYAYTGSADGVLHYFDIERSESFTVPTSDHVDFDSQWNQRNTLPLIRDVSWHPYSPVLIASSWRSESGSMLKLETEFS